VSDELYRTVIRLLTLCFVNVIVLLSLVYSSFQISCK